MYQNSDHSQSAIIKHNLLSAEIGTSPAQRLSGCESILLAGVWGSFQGWSLRTCLATIYDPSDSIGRLQAA